MEQEPKLETREQQKTRIIDLQWREYSGSVEHEILEIPVDWNMKEVLKQFKKETGIEDFGALNGGQFFDWLIKNGAKKADSEVFFLGPY